MMMMMISPSIGRNINAYKDKSSFSIATMQLADPAEISSLHSMVMIIPEKLCSWQSESLADDFVH